MPPKFRSKSHHKCRELITVAGPKLQKTKDILALLILFFACYATNCLLSKLLQPTWPFFSLGGSSGGSWPLPLLSCWLSVRLRHWAVVTMRASRWVVDRLFGAVFNKDTIPICITSTSNKKVITTAKLEGMAAAVVSHPRAGRAARNHTVGDTIGTRISNDQSLTSAAKPQSHPRVAEERAENAKGKGILHTTTMAKR